MRPVSALIATVLLLSSTVMADDVPTLQEVAPLVQQGKWSEAQKLLTKVVEAEPDNAQAIFYLAYSTHMNGQIKEALPLHKRAAAFDAFRPVATYNMACAYALLGKNEEAIGALKKSVAAGFANVEQIEGDDDFKNLRKDPGYKALLSELRAKTAPKGELIDLSKLDAERQFDFYKGDWNVQGGGAAFEVGVEQILNNRVLQINGPNFASLITYVPTLKEWKWTWVSNGGHHDVLVGGVKDGKMVLIQKVLRDRPQLIGRTVFHKIARDSFELDWSVSADNGETWRLEYHARYERKQDSKNNTAAMAQ